MRKPPILSVENGDLTYDDITSSLEQFATVEELEPSAGPSLIDLPTAFFDDDFLRIGDDLETVAELEAR